MAQPKPKARPPQASPKPSLENLGLKLDEWNAALALELLPETNGPRIEVYGGSVIVAPHAGVDHQNIERNLGYLLHQAARPAGLRAYPEINIISGSDLFIPDVSVVRTSGAGRRTMDISEAVLLVEIVSEQSRRKDLIDRPVEYAAAGVPWFMRVDLRNRVPAIVLHQLLDGRYEPLAAAAAGSTFTMKEPFAFTVDPADLLDD
jgi:Uma2 family endonuclease